MSVTVTQQAALWSNESNYSKLKNTIEIQLVKSAEVCGKILSEKNGYKSVKTALLLSNVIDADHQNSCLFTNKGHFSSTLWFLLVLLPNFMSNTLPIALARLLEYILTLNSFLKN